VPLFVDNELPGVWVLAWAASELGLTPPVAPSTDGVDDLEEQATTHEIRRPIGALESALAAIFATFIGLQSFPDLSKAFFHSSDPRLRKLRLLFLRQCGRRVTVQEPGVPSHGTTFRSPRISATLNLSACA